MKTAINKRPVDKVFGKGLFECNLVGLSRWSSQGSGWIWTRSWMTRSPQPQTWLCCGRNWGGRWTFSVPFLHASKGRRCRRWNAWEDRVDNLLTRWFGDREEKAVHEKDSSVPFWLLNCWRLGICWFFSWWYRKNLIFCWWSWKQLIFSWPPPRGPANGQIETPERESSYETLHFQLIYRKLSQFY